MVALVALGGLAALAALPLSPIAAVEVSGARHVTAEQAVTTSGLSGGPVFWSDSTAAREALLQIAAVRDARVEVTLPDRARIAIAEREAVVRWVVDGVEWFVDREGVVFASADGTAAPALRVYDGRVSARTAGERLDPELVEAATRLAKIAPGELRPDATSPRVRIDAGPNGLVLESGAGWEVRFGDADRFDEKLELARRFLEADPERRLEYLDVRSVDQLVFR